MNTNFHRVAVVGAGAMGQGIAQMCAQAGSKVWVHDVAFGAAEKACQAIFLQWQKLLDKSRVTAAEVAQWQERLHSATSLHELADCDLVIEAVVENMAIKTPTPEPFCWAAFLQPSASDESRGSHRRFGYARRRLPATGAFCVGHGSSTGSRQGHARVYRESRWPRLWH